MGTPYDTNGDPQSATLTSYYFGGAYEVTGTDVKKYYSFGRQTVRRDANGLKYMLTDHLGSVVAVTGETGTLITQQCYLPFGGERTDVGTITQTDFGYTGQRKLDPGIGGLMDYKARFYSPYINHFIQPDSLIPDPSNPQAWNRYSYVGNRPVNFNDPTGHMQENEDDGGVCGTSLVCQLGGSGSGNSSGGDGGSETLAVPDNIPIAPINTQTGTPSPSTTKNPPIIDGSSTPRPANPKKPVCTTPMPGSQINCSPSFEPSYLVHYTYEGSMVPVVGLAVDLGGMIVDGASILLLLGIPILGVPSVAGLESVMTVIEMGYSAGMNFTGQYDAVYDQGSNILGSQTARYTDTQEMVPIVGFTASLASAINNIQVISEDIVAHRVYLIP